jgi:ABC-type uncharacterized transport system ATPase subunit
MSVPGHEGWTSAPLSRGAIHPLPQHGQLTQVHMSNPDKVIEIEELKLSFGGVMSLNSVSMTVRRGELLALIGPNGAGRRVSSTASTAFIIPIRGSCGSGGIRELDRLQEKE